jgi:hypothetical protein
MERWPYPVPQAMQRHKGFRFAKPEPRKPVPSSAGADEPSSDETSEVDKEDTNRQN